MKSSILFLTLTVLLAVSCTSQKKLSYLNNLPDTWEPQTFPYKLDDYKIQYRDLLYIDVKAITPDGKIENILPGNNNANQAYIQGEANQYVTGYNVDSRGNILLPVVGNIHVATKTVSEIRSLVQARIDSIFNHAYVDVKLLGFKYTVLGEAKNPGLFMNYNDYLTVLEAIGRAGGVGDYGRRDRVLIVRSSPEGSKTYLVNLQDKELLTSGAYFIVPNDVIIIEPLKQKAFSMNLPSFSIIISAISSALLLINFFSN